ncbi:MAG TPA: HAMP domain-containing histidine kinase [Gammaproteobacteria bacterium]|nr:HAMP domain-containing histidine kinase [Gammaproteobacteria bacterium]
MNIRAHIFTWLFLGTIVPLTALAFAATYYFETDYRASLRDDLAGTLRHIATGLRRRLAGETRFVTGLARSPAIRDILPVLYARRRGNAHPELNIRRTRVNRFLEGFQTILPPVFVIRVMDYQGNTVVKVSHRRRSPPIYEGIEGFRLVEPELQDPHFVRQLDHLPRDRVSLLHLPHHELLSADLQGLPKQDYIMPLYHRKRLVGAVAVSLLNEELDSFLEQANRLHRSRLRLVELNPDNGARNGLVLFDDDRPLRLVQRRKKPVRLDDVNGTELLAHFEQQSEGELTIDGGGRLFYNTFFPYNDQLVSWVIMARIDAGELSAPFGRMRRVIAALGGLALVITLLLASIGVRQVSRPLARLSARLKRFAHDREPENDAVHTAVDEVRDIAEAFDYMAETLTHTEQERDRAQRMMLQHAKLASIGEMAAGIGHELNNPLNNILSYIKLARRGLPAEADAVRADLDAVQDEAVRASEIIQGILNFARQVKPRYELFAISPWLAATVRLVEQVARNNSITLRILDRCEPGEMLEGDRGQLQQALVNLLLNAIHASDTGGQVSISVRTEHDACIVSVRDEGRGIDSAILDKVFDPFFSTREEGQGTGLGLSISLGIVERHGGRLEIANNPDHGCTATLCIPLRASDGKMSTDHDHDNTDTDHSLR